MRPTRNVRNQLGHFFINQQGSDLSSAAQQLPNQTALADQVSVVGGETVFGVDFVESSITHSSNFVERQQRHGLQEVVEKVVYGEQSISGHGEGFDTPMELPIIYETVQISTAPPKSNTNTTRLDEIPLQVNKSSKPVPNERTKDFNLDITHHRAIKTSVYRHVDSLPERPVRQENHEGINTITNSALIESDDFVQMRNPSPSHEQNNNIDPDRFTPIVSDATNSRSSDES